MKSQLYEVRTIFYDVKPSVVRHQTGSYEEAFNNHQALRKTEVVQWRNALTKAADLSGWDLGDLANGFESKFIEMISKDIFHHLRDGPLHVGENLVGVYHRVDKMNLLRLVGSTEVHLIGICGISGVGKTTIAKALYNQLYVYFECYSFCEDVSGFLRSHSMVQLQKRLIEDILGAKDLKIWSVGEAASLMKQRFASKRVLIVLDNIDQPDQLEVLAGSRDWFGKGSLIVVIGKDRQVLKARGVEEIYNVEVLNDSEALELFSMHAFKAKLPKEGFIDLANRVIQYVKGHPLALKIIACFLCGKSAREWESELNQLQRYPQERIHQVLKLSYENLTLNQKSIFLDIACFFVGEDKDYVVKILDGCDLFADTNIRVLVDRSLVTVSSNNLLNMHNLLQRMGWDIIRHISSNPGEWSRLWLEDDVCDTLMNDKGTEAVRGLSLNLKGRKVQIQGKAFTRMTNLRLLKITDALEFSKNSMWNFSGSLEYLSNELRLLSWHGYPFKFLPSTFSPGSLVVLDMSYSDMKQLWTGSKGFQKLKTVKLSHCFNLTKTPDFTLCPSLEVLILEGCINLVEVHPSLGTLRKLLLLNLGTCHNLKTFPSIIGLESLQILNLSGCSKLEIGNLVELHADGAAIKKFHSYLSFLTNLQILELGCDGEANNSLSLISWLSSLLRIKHHPQPFNLPSTSALASLRVLHVRNCNLSEGNLDPIGYLSTLEELGLDGNNFRTIPSSFSHLSQLELLGLTGCKNLQAPLELPPNLYVIAVDKCMALSTFVKPSIKYKSSTLSFRFITCSKLAENESLHCLTDRLLPQEGHEADNYFNVLIPGRRIPMWYCCQNMGDCVKMELPPAWCSTKFRRLAYCAVLTLRNTSEFRNRSVQVGLTVQNIDDNFLIAGMALGIAAFPKETRWVESDQLWLGYIRWGDWKKAKNHIKVSFEVEGFDCQVKMGGVRLVCEENHNAVLLHWPFYA